MSDVVLSAHEHFEALREGVWLKLCARPGLCTRERFDEAYAEWWARELERSAAGRPSRAASPVAFLAESVHRVLIDDARARARGLAREEKVGLELVDLDSQAGATSGVATDAEAGYEALVHRVLTLVQGELSHRELRVFVYCFLYMASTPEAASALSLSHARVKKDRDRILRKVGEQVWGVLNGELELCAAYDRKALGAVFEILSVHVEDCPTCGAALGSLRSSALAIMPPALLMSGTSEGVTEVVSHAADSLTVRLSGLVHRASETLAAMPAGGRTAAAVAVAASAVAGGAVTVTAPQHHRRHLRPPLPVEHVVRRHVPPATASVGVAPSARATPAHAPAAVPTAATSHGMVAAAVVVRRAHRPRREPFATATAASREDVGFEAQAAPVSTGAVAAAVATPVHTAAPVPKASPSQEFGFEHP